VSLGVFFGGPAPEHDVSILTGLQALRELARSSPAVGVYWTKSGEFVAVDPEVEAESFLDGVPTGSSTLELRLGEDGGFHQVAGRLSRARRLDIEALVMATHGGPGEDGTIQGLLDLAGISYTGPTVAGAALGMDKLSFGATIQAAGLPVLPRALLNGTASVGFDGPYIVKPRFGGSSIGIDVVSDLATAAARLGANVHLANGAVVEPFRRDLEDLQIAVRTYPRVELSAIERPIRRSSATEILDYRDKYVGGEGMVSAPRELPATLETATREAIEEMARAIVEVASVRGVARVDFLAGPGELYVNEINTIPGSLSKHLFVEPALPFAQLLADMLAEARERPTHRYSSAGADGLVLRSAGSIAAKLA
jgi:D-alanine-D-alanine ligase